MNPVLPSVSSNNSQLKKQDLLCLAFTYIPTLGWTEAAFCAAAKELGHEGLYYHLFPQGIPDTILFYGSWLDGEVQEKLRDIPFEALGTTEKITLLALTRVNLQQKHRNCLKCLMKVTLHPALGSTGMKLLARTVDNMWRHAGDDATDFNYYSKRGLLGMIYANTLIYSLRHDQPQEVEAFFRKQLSFLFKGVTTAKSTLQTVKLAAKSIFSTVGLR